MGASRNKPLVEEPVLQAMSACISRYIMPGDSVAVGYSGGLDSTVLLHAAHIVAKSAEVSLSAVHIHHGLNPDADSWAESCGEVCGSLDVPLTVVRVRVDTKDGTGIEAAARRERHQVLAEHPAQWILLAHHANDQAETMLHNLLRGTGVRGAAGMPSRRGRLLRPFLGLTRTTLEDFAEANDLRWVEDGSNTDSRFTRNYLRASVLPPLEARFPRAAENLAAAAQRFGEASSLLDELARLDLNGREAAFPLPLSLLNELSDARARNLLRALLAWLGVQAPDEPRLNEFARQVREAGPDRHPRLDLAGYSLHCEKGLICFHRTD